MNLRLLKKKRRGPFQELGIELTVQLRATADFDRFLNDFILRAVEANGLFFGGGGDSRENRLSGIVELGRRTTDIEAKRDAVLGWLRGHPDVVSVETGRTIDLWYDDEE